MSRGRPSKCPACGSSRSVSKGLRYRHGGNTRKDRKCKDCGRRYLI